MAPKKKATRKEEADKAEKADAPAPSAEAEIEPELQGEEDYQEDFEEEVGGEPDEALDAEEVAADAKAPAPAAKAADSKAEAAKGDKEDEDEDDEAPAAKSMPKGKEKPKELEVDAEPDSRGRVSSVALSEYDSTLDVFFSGGGSIVSSLSQGGFQHLLSGVRANTGTKSGRHLFEVKVLEKKTTEGENTNSMRIGVSTARSSLFLGDKTPDSACFDLDGTYYSPTPEDPKKRHEKAFTRKIQFQVIGILLNLDSGSPNANTLSLFLDGVRVSEPLPLPAHLVGKALYPTITFKNFTLAVNLGNDGLVMKRLPFACRMFGTAAAADTESSNYVSPSAGSKYQVVVPVGLPEEGFFDYTDRFLERHPEYVELSDRKLQEWCVKSGLTGASWKNSGGQASKDRPVFSFGITSIDNMSIRNQVRQLTQLVKRHYIVGELKGNLMGKEREEVLARFAAQNFSVTAHVAVGEPPSDHKDWVHSKINAAFAKKQADALAVKKRQEERKRLAAERIAEREAKKAASKDTKEGDKEASDEPPAKKQKVEEEVKDEVKEEEKNEEKEAGPDIGPHVWWLPHSRNAPDDMLKKVLAGSYVNFTLPSASDGFDKVEFMWAPKAGSEEHMQKWVVEQKATLYIEDLKPGEWFKEKKKVWSQRFNSMRTKNPNREKAAKKEKSNEDAAEDGKASEEKAEEAVDPLHAVGEDGKPVYAEFKNEDWSVLKWRYDLHLLLHGFAADAAARDVNLVGIPVDHISHYFMTYFSGRKFSPKALGFPDLEKVVDLMDDMLKIETSGKKRFLVSLIDKDTEHIDFVKKVEENRQDRVRRIEAGDESARLKIPEGGFHDDGDRSGKKGKGKGKGKKGKDNRKGGQSSQEKQEGNWKKQGSFGRSFGFRRQEAKGSGKKGFKRDRQMQAPRQEVATRPWDRNRATTFAKPQFEQRKQFHGKGRSNFNDRQRQPQQQEQRSAPAWQQKRPQPQQEARREFPRRGGEKGGGPRNHSDGPDPKRPRWGNQPPAVHTPPVPPRPPQHSRPTPSTGQRPSGFPNRGPPQRNPAPSSQPPPVPSRDGSRPGKGGGKSKGDWRDSGGNRDNKGHGRDFGGSSQDRGGYVRGGSTSKGGGHSDRGGNKGGDRRPNDTGKDRHYGNDKGGKGDRRDARDRGHPQSGGHHRGERDHRDQNRRQQY